MPYRRGTADPSMTLETYQSNLRIGARQYLFYYIPSFPLGNGDVPKTGKLVRSMSLPASVAEPITINWQGYAYKIAGRQTFSDWSVTFTLDADGASSELTRTNFLQWMSGIHEPTDNVHGIPAQYFATQTLDLIDPHNHQPIMVYNLVDAWPTNISEVTLDYGTNDVAQYTVTFAYQYHTIKDVNQQGRGGRIGGQARGSDMTTAARRS